LRLRRAQVLVSAFYALDRRKTPMVVSFLAVGLNLLLKLDAHPAFGLGSSRAGVLHRLRRHQQLPHSLFPHALAPRAPGIAGDARAAVEGGAGLGGTAGDLRAGAHFLLADWAVQRFWRSA